MSLIGVDILMPRLMLAVFAVFARIRSRFCHTLPPHFLQPVRTRRSFVRVATNIKKRNEHLLIALHTQTHTAVRVLGVFRARASLFAARARETKKKRSNAGANGARFIALAAVSSVAAAQRRRMKEAKKRKKGMSPRTCWRRLSRRCRDLLNANSHAGG